MNFNIVFDPEVVIVGEPVVVNAKRDGIDYLHPEAKRLLASFDRFRGRESLPHPPMHESAKRWLDEVFYPTVSLIPLELQGRIEAAQFFHEALEHRWYLSEKAGHDVGLEFAALSYIADVLPMRRDSGVDLNVTSA